MKEIQKLFKEMKRIKILIVCAEDLLKFYNEEADVDEVFKKRVKKRIQELKIDMDIISHTITNKMKGL